MQAYREATEAEKEAWLAGHVSGDQYQESPNGLLVKVTHLWSAGHGMRGYLPDSSPSLHTSWEGAVESTLYDLDQYSDFFFQGMDQVWIDFYNHTIKSCDDEQVREDDCDIDLVWEFFCKVKDGHWEHGVPMDDVQWELCKGAIECEREMRELRRLDPDKVTKDMPWAGWAGNQHYFIEESERESNDIPADLEGEELDEMVQELNENGW